MCVGRGSSEEAPGERAGIPHCPWRQDTCVPYFPPYFLCKWVSFSICWMDAWMSEWILSNHVTLWDLTLPTAGRSSHSSSFLQFSDPTNAKNTSYLEWSYLGNLVPHMDPRVCHRNNVSNSALPGNCLNILPGLHRKERGGLPAHLKSVCIKTITLTGLEVVRDFVSKCVSDFNQKSRERWHVGRSWQLLNKI